MRLIVHDTELSDEDFRRSDGDVFIAARKLKAGPCIGCFGCWLKTPGRCVLRDDLQDTGKLYCDADEIVLITQCTYGGYSPEVKNVFDRSIGFLLPFFTDRGDHRMHHLIRREKPRTLTVYFYGETTEKERSVAKRIVQANAINIDALSGEATFHDNPNDVVEALA